MMGPVGTVAALVAGLVFLVWAAVQIMFPR
jgi:hypothetical protein